MSLKDILQRMMVFVDEHRLVGGLIIAMIGILATIRIYFKLSEKLRMVVYHGVFDSDNRIKLTIDDLTVGNEFYFLPDKDVRDESWRVKPFHRKVCMRLVDLEKFTGFSSKFYCPLDQLAMHALSFNHRLTNAEALDEITAMHYLNISPSVFCRMASKYAQVLCILIDLRLRKQEYDEFIRTLSYDYADEAARRYFKQINVLFRYKRTARIQFNRRMKLLWAEYRFRLIYWFTTPQLFMIIFFLLIARLRLVTSVFISTLVVTPWLLLGLKFLEVSTVRWARKNCQMSPLSLNVENSNM